VALANYTNIKVTNWRMENPVNHSGAIFRWPTSCCWVHRFIGIRYD